MATKLGSLLIELGLDSAKFRSGTRQAQREMTTFQRGVSSSAGLVKAALGGMVAAISVDMFATAIKSGLDYASSLGEVALQLGVTTRTLQEYRYAATQVGLTQEEMDAGLARLTRTLGTSPEKFEKLGIAIRGANGEIEDAGEILPRIAEAYRKAGSEADKSRLMYELFGRSGQKFAPLFAEGAAGINQLRDAAQRLGIVLSDEQIQNADETADKLAAVQTVLQARIAGVVADNADSIVTLTDALAKLTEESIRFGARGVTAWRQFGWELDRLTANIARNLPGVSQAVMDGAQAELDRIDTEQFGGPRIRINPAPAGHVPGTPYPQPGQRAPAAPPQRQRRAPGAGTGWMGTPQAQRRMSGGAFADIDVSGIIAFALESEGAAKTATPTLRAMSDEVASLLDRLNPLAAAQRELTENTILLKQAYNEGQISLAQYSTGLAQLRREYGVAGEGLIDWREVIGDVGGATADAVEQMNGATWAVDSLADSIEDSAERSAEAAERQQQALFDMLGSIRNFANSLKSGDILGVVEGVLGILESIGGLTGGFNIGGMQFGTGASSRIPRFAGGTNFAPGGLSWVGERGAELVNLPRGASVTPNHALKGLSGSQVQIVPSPYFDVVVDGRVMNAAPGIAAAGSQGAQMAMARRGSRRLA